jgi:class 3 adenylate cyclase
MLSHIGPQPTILFADLAGFTALTEAHGDRQAAYVAAEFFIAVRGLLSFRAAREVKTIGDALMIRGSDAAKAIELGLEIVDDVGRQHGFPAVRVGMNTGQALERDGDWFGKTVNVAGAYRESPPAARCCSPRQPRRRRVTFAASACANADAPH